MTHTEKINIVRIAIYILTVACFFLIKAIVQNNIDETNKDERKKRHILIITTFFFIIALFGMLLYVEK